MVPPARVPGTPRQGSGRDRPARSRRAGAVPARVGDLAHRLLHPRVQLLPVRAGAPRGRPADLLPRHGGLLPGAHRRVRSARLLDRHRRSGPRRGRSDRRAVRTGTAAGRRARCLAPDRPAVPAPVPAVFRRHRGRRQRGAGGAAQDQVAERDRARPPRRPGRRSRHGRGRSHRAGRHHGADAGRSDLRSPDPRGKRHAGPGRPLLRRARLPPARQLHRPRARGGPDRPVRGARLRPSLPRPLHAHDQGRPGERRGPPAGRAPDPDPGRRHRRGGPRGARERARRDLSQRSAVGRPGGALHQQDLLRRRPAAATVGRRGPRGQSRRRLGVRREHDLPHLRPRARLRVLRDDPRDRDRLRTADELPPGADRRGCRAPDPAAGRTGRPERGRRREESHCRHREHRAKAHWQADRPRQGS